LYSMSPGMKPNHKRAITLIELLVSIVLLWIVLLGLYGIDIFSHQQFIASDKRSKVQNEASFVLSHISKNLLRAIGDIDPANQAVTITAGGNTAIILATIDSSSDGIRNFPGDSIIGYCFNNNACGPAAGATTMVFNGNMSASPAVAEVIANHVQSFNAVLNQNYLNLTISTCWDPDGTPLACGTLDNPSMNLTSIIKMPSVSAQ